MTAAEQKTLALELLDALLGSWWTVVAGVCIGAAVALVVLRHTPEVFEAQATIAADVDKLPPGLVQRTVSDDLDIRLKELRSAVLSDENLHQVIVGEFREQSSPEVEASLADRIRSRVGLSFAKLSRTISVTYRDYNPERAADVTDMFANFFVQENKRLRTENATGVRTSLEALTVDVETELEQLKREQSTLLAKHPRELESQRLSNDAAVQALQKQLDDEERSVAAARHKLAVEEADLSRRKLEQGRGTPAPLEDVDDVPITDPDITALEGEIEKLLLRVTENHPEVQKKRREIERIRASGRAPTPTAGPQAVPESPGSAEPLGLDIWDTRIEAARLELARLETNTAKVRSELGRYQGYLANTPVIQQQLDTLSNRISVLELPHRENLRKIEAARSGEQLERDDNANPFVVTGYAIAPSKPVSPVRAVFLAVGVAGGLLAFVGTLLARQFLSPKILSEAGLRAMSAAPVLVSIPILPTPEVARRRRRAVRTNFGLSFFSASLLCAVVALWRLNLL